MILKVLIETKEGVKFNLDRFLRRILWQNKAFLSLNAARCGEKKPQFWCKRRVKMSKLSFTRS